VEDGLGAFSSTPASLEITEVSNHLFGLCETMEPLVDGFDINGTDRPTLGEELSREMSTDEPSRSSNDHFWHQHLPGG
jgi:hypothetical protein